MKATVRTAALLSGAALTFGLVLGGAPAAHAGGGNGNKDASGHRVSVSSEDRGDHDTSDWPQGKSLSDPDGGGWDKPGGDVGDDDRDGNNGCGNDDDRSDDNNGNCGGQREVAGGVAGEVEADDEETDESCAAGSAGEKAGDVDGNHGSDVKAAATSRDGDDNHGAKVSAVAKSNDRSAARADGDDAGDDECPESGDDDNDGDDTLSAAGNTTGPRTNVAAGASGEGVLGAQVLGATEFAPVTTPTVTPAPSNDTQVLGISETAPDTLARTGAGLGVLALAGAMSLGGGRLAALVRRRIDS